MGERTSKVKSGRDVADPALEPTSTRSQSETGEDTAEAAQIRSGIEQTRADLSDTIDALQDKLEPSRLAERVKDQLKEKAAEAYDSAKTAVREATIGKAEKLVSNVSETVSDVAGRAGTAVKDTSSSVAQYIRDNPMPFALIGIGIGMLAMNRRKRGPSAYAPGSAFRSNVYGAPEIDDATRSGSSLADRARDMATGVAESARGAAETATSALSSAATGVRDAAASAADTTREKLNYVGDQARQSARVATDRFKSTLEENPIALGIAALAAGAIVGLTLPGTRVEDEYMGETRDRLVEQAKSVAQQASEKVKRVTEEAGRTIKDAAQKEGLITTEGGDNPSS